MIIPILASAAFASPLFACADPREIGQVADHFDVVQQRQDRAELEALVDPDLIYINGRGELKTRQDFFDVSLAPVQSVEPFLITERRIVPLGEGAAAVSGLGQVTGVSVQGQRFDMRLRFMDVFSCRDGRWRVVAVQVTPAAETGDAR